MKNKFSYLQKIFVLVIMSTIFLSSVTVNSQSASVTDTSNDVMNIHTVQGTNDIPVVTVKTVSDHANIDILSANYTGLTNGSAIISLTVRGVIVTDNHTYYEMQIIDNNPGSYFLLEIYYSLTVSVDFQDTVSNTKFLYQNASFYAFGNMMPYVEGSTLVCTLGTHVTTADNNNFTVSLPVNFNDSWQWHIKTWQGNNTYDTYGDQYVDFYPNSDNKYISLTTSTKPAPGFELLSLLGIPALVIIKYKKTKKI